MEIPSNIEKEIKETAIGWFVSGIEEWSATTPESIEDALNEGKTEGKEWELWYPFENDNPAHVAGLALDLEGHFRRIVLLAQETIKEKMKEYIRVLNENSDNVDYLRGQVELGVYLFGTPALREELEGLAE